MPVNLAFEEVDPTTSDVGGLVVLPRDPSANDASAVGTSENEGERERLIGLLREHGVIESHIRAAVNRQGLTGEPLTAIMHASDYGFLSPEKIAQVNAGMAELTYFPPSMIDALDVSTIPEGARPTELAYFLPIGFNNGKLTIAVSEARLMSTAHEKYYQYNAHYVVASERTIQSIYRQFFSDTEEQFDKSYAQLRAMHEDDDRMSETLARVVMNLLRHACYKGASDINLLPMASKTGAAIRLKVDGVGDIFRFVEWAIFLRLRNFFKSNATGVEKLKTEPIDDALNFSKVRGAQDYPDIVRRYSFRIVLIQQIESDDDVFLTVTLRISDQEAEAAELDQSGIDEPTRKKLGRYMRAKSGMLLITGPTGSGKTNTMYSLLGEVDPVARWIQTVEKPIERRRGMWGQYQVPAAKDEGVGARSLLKGLLRNAPDVIVTGEIRNLEIANIAIESAMTGHVELGTSHNNRAHELITRFKQMGCDMSTVAESLLGILALRLVRKLCVHCREVDTSPETEAALRHEWLKEAKTPHKAVGCPRCDFKGYRGRQLIHELLDVKKTVRSAISDGVLPSKIAEDHIPVDRSIAACALRLVANGTTSFDEVEGIVRGEFEEEDEE